jgi:hypothetical protein
MWSAVRQNFLFRIPWECSLSISTRIKIVCRAASWAQAPIFRTSLGGWDTTQRGSRLQSKENSPWSLRLSNINTEGMEQLSDLCVKAVLSTEVTETLRKDIKHFAALKEVGF